MSQKSNQAAHSYIDLGGFLLPHAGNTGEKHCLNPQGDPSERFSKGPKRSAEKTGAVNAP